MSLATRVAARRRLADLVKTGLARDVRVRAGLSIADVAEDLGVARSRVHEWETGAAFPRGENADRYLAALEEIQAAIT
jgi:DNA-binding transcriptional regulator YiaG